MLILPSLKPTRRPPRDGFLERKRQQRARSSKAILVQELCNAGLIDYVEIVRRVAVDYHDLTNLEEEEIQQVVCELPTPAKQRAFRALVLKSRQEDKLLDVQEVYTVGDEEDSLVHSEASGSRGSLLMPTMFYRPPPAAGKAYVLPSSLLGRMAMMVPMFELMVPKDHHPLYKASWIESRREDGGRLREEMLFAYELELIFSSLFLSIFAPLAVTSEVVTSDMVETFVAGRLGDLNFWLVLCSVWFCVASIFQIISSYLALQAVVVVPASNIYAFLKSEAASRAVLGLPNIWIVLQFYLGLGFLLLLLLSHSLGPKPWEPGTFWFVLPLVLGPVLIGAPLTFGLFSYAFNLSCLSGCLGDAPVVPDHVAISATPAELDTKLGTLALHTLNRYGHGFPATALYGAKPSTTAMTTDSPGQTPSHDHHTASPRGESRVPAAMRPSKKLANAKDAPKSNGQDLVQPTHPVEML